MKAIHDIPSDIAFTPAVKAIQERKGSRRAYAHMEQETGWQTTIGDDLKGFIEEQVSAYLATANAAGQPYIQHRGGPAGFLHVLDEHTIAFADFAGNRQYITSGNLQENAKAHLFLMDYATQRRVKIWGEAKVIEDDPALVARLMPPGYKARGERAIVFTVAAWDVNCPKHIPRWVSADEVIAVVGEKNRRIEALEDEVQRLRARLAAY